MIRQKLIRTDGQSQEEVNKFLNQGWIVKEFKPLGGSCGTFCYVLLEKDEEDELPE